MRTFEVLILSGQDDKSFFELYDVRNDSSSLFKRTIMICNQILKLGLLFLGAASMHSSHAMLVQRAMNRSGTKYIAQLAQNVQKRFVQTESGKNTPMSPEDMQKRLITLRKEATETAAFIAGAIIIATTTNVVFEKFELGAKLRAL